MRRMLSLAAAAVLTGTTFLGSAPVAQAHCTINAGWCSAGHCDINAGVCSNYGRCAVNLGTCTDRGSCVLNISYCDDSSLVDVIGVTGTSHH